MYNLSLSDVLTSGLIQSYDDQYCSNVYFLSRDGCVVYVGQSVDVGARLIGHSDKSFDAVSFIRVSMDSVSDVEAFYIVKFKPEYNKGMHKNNLYLSTAKLKVGLRYINDAAIDRLDCCEDIVFKSNGKRDNKFLTREFFNRVLIDYEFGIDKLIDSILNKGE